MKSVAIRDNYNLEQHRHKLQFEDELPLVVAYIRYDDSPDIADLPGPQMASVLRMLDDRFGQYAFNVIWVIEEASGSRPTCSEGLALVADLLKSGYGRYLAVKSLDRLTRRLRTCLDLEENVLLPDGVELLTCSGSDLGPGPIYLIRAALAGISAGGE